MRISMDALDKLRSRNGIEGEAQLHVRDMGGGSGVPEAYRM